MEDEDISSSSEIVAVLYNEATASWYYADVTNTGEDEDGHQTYTLTWTGAKTGNMVVGTYTLCVYSEEDDDRQILVYKENYAVCREAIEPSVTAQEE